MPRSGQGAVVAASALTGCAEGIFLFIEVVGSDLSTESGLMLLVRGTELAVDEMASFWKESSKGEAASQVCWEVFEMNMMFSAMEKV